MSATETSAVPRRALGRRFRVPGLIAAAAAAAAVLYYAVLAGLGPPDALAIPWWGLALAFFLAEAFPVHVHFRSEAHSLSLSELALVLGLYAAPPGELLSFADLGRKFRELGAADSIELLRTLPMSVWDLLDDTFRSEALKAAVAPKATTTAGCRMVSSRLSAPSSMPSPAFCSSAPSSGSRPPARRSASSRR